MYYKFETLNYVKKSLNLDGVVFLNKEQQQVVNVGKKYVTIPDVPNKFELDFDI